MVKNKKYLVIVTEPIYFNSKRRKTIYERGSDGDNVNVVRYYFNLGSLDV